MKQAIITLGIIFLLANLAFGLVLDSFETFNLLMSSGAILFTTGILLVTENIKIKDAFKVSLHLINCFCGLVEYIIALISKQEMQNNWFYVALIFMIAFQLVLITVTNITSKKIE